MRTLAWHLTLSGILHSMTPLTDLKVKWWSKCFPLQDRGAHGVHEVSRHGMKKIRLGTCMVNRNRYRGQLCPAFRVLSHSVWLQGWGGVHQFFLSRWVAFGPLMLRSASGSARGLLPLSPAVWQRALWTGVQWEKQLQVARMTPRAGRSTR